ncbi:SRPBCC family protein [Halostreptopolyspora alba]|uniref:Activator of HSP90 ATPase n=1 Tax=Halostreptopolyspora alba TaxID=2487137 RepID=A0A3N0DY73_9ACTN|nr:activator of HSP90 ATPase [Nocardiopsaceae bacterium YIM 96095]
MTEDRIERDIHVAAPVERVWAVLTEADHIAGWFGESARIDALEPGGTLWLGWAEFGEYPAVIDRVEPPRVFAFRWTVDSNDHPGVASEHPREGNATLVEFTLSAEAGGTRLSVVESGFTRLGVPAEQQERARQQNIEGWGIELDELREYAERSAAPST